MHSRCLIVIRKEIVLGNVKDTAALSIESIGMYYDPNGDRNFHYHKASVRGMLIPTHH